MVAFRVWEGAVWSAPKWCTRYDIINETWYFEGYQLSDPGWKNGPDYYDMSRPGAEAGFHRHGSGDSEYVWLNDATEGGVIQPASWPPSASTGFYLQNANPTYPFWSSGVECRFEIRYRVRQTGTPYAGTLRLDLDYNIFNRVNLYTEAMPAVPAVATGPWTTFVTSGTFVPLMNDGLLYEYLRGSLVGSGKAVIDVAYMGYRVAATGGWVPNPPKDAVDGVVPKVWDGSTWIAQNEI